MCEVYSQDVNDALSLLVRTPVNTFVIMLSLVSIHRLYAVYIDYNLCNCFLTTEITSEGEGVV